MIDVSLPDGTSVHGLTRRDTRTVWADIDAYGRNGVEINDGDTVLDVGANTGLFLRWLDRCGVRARVYSFEPVPQIFEVLVKNASYCKNLDCRLRNVGLGWWCGTAPVFFYPRMSQASTETSSLAIEKLALQHILAKLPRFLPFRRWIAGLAFRWYMKREIVACKIVTLSQVLADEHIDDVALLKIDAEGSEHRILAGINDADWPKIKQLIVEVHEGSESTRKIELLLESKGFQTVTDCNPTFPALAIVYARRINA